jgi:hypothetical protein
LTFGIWASLRTRLTLSATPPFPPGRFTLPEIDSKTISSIPNIFSVFTGKGFELLYRGSRDGFGADAFHGRCDGHPNTVTLVLSTTGCIFGGYTPLAWSFEGGSVSDPSLDSFLFTIKNPHNLPPRIFKLKQAKNAIYGQTGYGPKFGDAAPWSADLYVCSQCQTSGNSYSNLGKAYVNDSGISGNHVLTGSQDFLVQEIEVFEVI